MRRRGAAEAYTFRLRPILMTSIAIRRGVVRFFFFDPPQRQRQNAMRWARCSQEDDQSEGLLPACCGASATVLSIAVEPAKRRAASDRPPETRDSKVVGAGSRRPESVPSCWRSAPRSGSTPDPDTTDGEDRRHGEQAHHDTSR